MTITRTVTTLVIAGTVLMLPASPSAQASRTFKARLSTVPVEAATLAGLTGSGTVTAVLTGAKLAVTGTFQGLQTAATTAHLRLGPKGIRGPIELTLTVTTATKGTINADLVLTPTQIDHLRRSRLYVQIQCEKAPDGNLWGWLLPQEPQS